MLRVTVGLKTAFLPCRERDKSEYKHNPMVGLYIEALHCADNVGVRSFGKPSYPLTIPKHSVYHSSLKKERAEMRLREQAEKMEIEERKEGARDDAGEDKGEVKEGDGEVKGEVEDKGEVKEGDGELKGEVKEGDGEVKEDDVDGEGGDAGAQTAGTEAAGGETAAEGGHGDPEGGDKGTEGGDGAAEGDDEGDEGDVGVQQRCRGAAEVSGSEGEESEEEEPQTNMQLRNPHNWFTSYRCVQMRKSMGMGTVSRLHPNGNQCEETAFYYFVRPYSFPAFVPIPTCSCAIYHSS